MKISLACDHGGLSLKLAVKQHLEALGHQVEDFGTHTRDSCDYSDFAAPAAQAVAKGQCERGIVICTTGIGVSITANKVKGIRCALLSDLMSARLTRQQARDSAISLLEDAAKQEDADKEVANQASESIQVLASYTLKEAQIENLVTAKGYTDCVAFMGDDSLSIVVSTADGTLNSTDVAKITDIAMTETGYAASAIRIMASN